MLQDPIALTPSGAQSPVLVPGYSPDAGRAASEYAILQAVVHAASAFLQNTDMAASLDALLAGIGQATGASRVSVFENDPPQPGMGITSSQCAEWTAPGINPEIDSPAVKNMSLGEGDGFELWIESFKRGIPFVAVTSDLPPSARARLLSVDVLSIAAVPVMVEGEYWGFISVDNCVTERRWSAVEVEALTAAAVVLGAAVRRRRSEEALRAATTQAQLAADIGEVVTGEAGTLQEMLDLCSAAIVRRLEPDMIRIWMLSESLECLIACTAAGARTIQRVGRDMPEMTPELLQIAGAEGPTFWHDGVPPLWPGAEAEYEAAGIRAGVAYPLVTSGRVNGIAVLLGRQMPKPAVIDALGSVTDELALAIERHHAQGAANRAETRYRRLVNATVEGIIIHNGERVIDANPSFAAMVGYTPEEVLQMHPFAFIPPEYHEFVSQQIQAKYEHPYEIEGLHKDGTRFPVELKGSDFTDASGMLRVAAVRDISDRRKVQQTTEQLREEQQARALAERTRAQAQFLGDASRILASSLDTTTTLTQLAHLSVPMLGDYCVVSVLDDHTVRRVAVVHSDPEMAKLMRATVDSWPDHFPDHHPISSAIAAGRPFLLREVAESTFPSIVLSPEHGEMLRKLAPQSLMAVPILSGGIVLGSIMLTSTRPDRLYGDDDLALATEFAHRAGLALQAAHSYHAALAATRSRDEMLAVVAHDLRNPLNTIFMGSELALEVFGETAAAVGVRQLQIIRRSADHMNRLIQDLLDASRIESGNLALELAALTPQELLREASEMLEPLASHQKIAFVAEADPNLPTLQADKSRLLQVLSNLVGNALKFTPQGGRIMVGASCQDGLVTFRVADTGAGIPADQISHIFGRFWQAKKTDRRGIGLGLAIATGIVEAHGGRIWVESKVNEGSTFLFTVPGQISSP